MHFRHPEILYALFFLIIPVLIHLFNFQRFTVQRFTNVQFLQEIQAKSRKANQLKKRLILLSRLLALASLILAFAQPYWAKEKMGENMHTIIYIDNSMSMQSKMENEMNALRSGINEIIGSLNDLTGKFSLITNNDRYVQIDKLQLREHLLAIDFTPSTKKISTVLNELNYLSQGTHFETTNVIFVSDFNLGPSKDELELNNDWDYYFVDKGNLVFENVVLDSVWVSSRSENNIVLSARIRATNKNFENLSVSLLLEDQLFGKTSIDLNENETQLINFDVPTEKASRGTLSLSDQRMSFDNSLFFSFTKRNKQNITIIGSLDEYFQRLYPSEEFSLNQVAIDSIEPDQLSDQDLIILNHLPSISKPLLQTLRSLDRFGANLVIIPPDNPDLNSYNELLVELGVGSITAWVQKELTINRINYEHPFFKSVFNEQIENFAYPNTASSLQGSFDKGSTLLGLENGDPFLSEFRNSGHHIYWFSSSLKNENTDFREHPLIVPVFYNFSKTDDSDAILYFQLGKENEVLLKQQDVQEQETLKIQKGDETFIPLQIINAGQVRVTTYEYPEEPGTYFLMKKEDTLRQMSFNYNREESISQRIDIDQLIADDNAQLGLSGVNAISDINDRFRERSLWQLFITFVLVFLLTEILLQKYLKD